MLKHMLAHGSLQRRHPADMANGRTPEILIDDKMRVVSPNSHALNSSVSLSVQSTPGQVPSLNLCALNTSKHSIGGNSSSATTSAAGKPMLDHSTLSKSGMTHDMQILPMRNGDAPKMANGGLHLSRSMNNKTSIPTQLSRLMLLPRHAAAGQMLASLGLLCLLALLLALLALLFLLNIPALSPNDVRNTLQRERVRVITIEEYTVVYEVTLALCALTLSLNLCCLLVCAVQFLFVVKLSKVNDRASKFMRRSSATRICAIGGFFVSIPVFLTGIVLYTLIQFYSTPAIVTSALIGFAIIFCGCAVVHNVFVWQREKSKPSSSPIPCHQYALESPRSFEGNPDDFLPGAILPSPTLDLSGAAQTIVNGTGHAHELSTLV